MSSHIPVPALSGSAPADPPKPFVSILDRRPPGSALALEDLLERALDGDRRSLARVFTRMERDREDLSLVMKKTYSHPGHSVVVGITGPPGAGKSTIVDGLAGHARSEDKTVGVLAVDPTSPITGGAVLGDRIRMQGHHLDRGVFIRSIATRGAPGGLATVSRAAVTLLDAAGKDLILVETVGVGQTELDIVALADAVVVALVPEAGDSVQAMKAGLLEIADVFVVNKSDRDGAGQLASAIRSMIALDPRPNEQKPPVLMTEAHRGKGLGELYALLDERLASDTASGRLASRRSEQSRQEVARLLTAEVSGAVEALIETDDRAAALMSRVAPGDLDPYSAARQILDSGLVTDALNALRSGAGGTSVIRPEGVADSEESRIIAPAPADIPDI